MTYPADVDPEEVLVRIVRAPQFLSKNGLKPSVLRPQRGTDRVSVVRWLYRERPGEVFKSRCQKIGSSGINKFCGLAVLTAQSCLDAELGLEDDRQSFQGHANIVFPFVVKDSEPQEGEAFSRQAEIANRILSSAKYVPDPTPDAAEWSIQSELLPD